mmetsp:Transcript_9803/g.24456  ORF Transcript_9803/g.24456 Transcript_9803/m.24456 type:complete len:206 (+) Transcript_9803:107-724(+)
MAAERRRKITCGHFTPDGAHGTHGESHNHSVRVPNAAAIHRLCRWECALMGYSQRPVQAHIDSGWGGGQHAHQRRFPVCGATQGRRRHHQSVEHVNQRRPTAHRAQGCRAVHVRCQHVTSQRRAGQHHPGVAVQPGSRHLLITGHHHQGRGRPHRRGAGAHRGGQQHVLKRQAGQHPGVGPGSRQGSAAHRCCARRPASHAAAGI